MKIKCAYLTAFLLGICLLSTSAQPDVLQPGFNQIPVGAISGGTRAFGVGMADFNGDGIADIVSGQSNGSVILFTGNGNGVFTNAGVVIDQISNNAYGLSVADFNGDGKMDIVLTACSEYAADNIYDGEIHLYLGNGNGTFQSIQRSLSQEGIVKVGDIGDNCAAVTSGDVDGDGDIDIIAGDNLGSGNNAADIVLFRNTGNDINGRPTWAAGVVIDSATGDSTTDLPYYPPSSSTASYQPAYGLALGKMDNDNDLDLLVTDRAGYLYIYRNNGSGSFTPIQFDRVGGRPYAYAYLHNIWGPITVACGDLNGDGLTDFITGGSDVSGTVDYEGAVDLWLNTGVDGSNRPQFLNCGIIGRDGTDAKGLAIGQVNSSVDAFADIVFGNNEARLNALITNRADTDGDGIIDLYDNAPLHPNAPRLDMNVDGSFNYLDQLDNDFDGNGDPNDPDDDNDGIPDVTDNCPFTYNPDQANADADGIGNACDCLNNRDSDGDGILDGPIDTNLFHKAQLAKGNWSRSNTHFIVRVDALGRVWQNEFTQVFADAAILTPEVWDVNKYDSYNGIGDSPATAGYQVPANLPGGKNVPITLLVIPKLLWYDYYGDPDPIRWINHRISNPNLEIAQHGTYHADTTALGGWAEYPIATELCGFDVTENYQYLRIGKRTLLGQYADDDWILQSGAIPGTSAVINWSIAANPLISYAPPYNASDMNHREAVAELGYIGFSASIWEETTNAYPYSPEGSHHEQFDQFGMFHASADLQVNPVIPTNYPKNTTYQEYLSLITHPGLNTWLIEEVEWSTRDQSNAVNNMVDPNHWDEWMTLLDYVKANGQPMTMGDYSLAMAFDNAPTVANPDQADSDHDGVGDVIDGAQITAENVQLQFALPITSGILTAMLTNNSVGIANQTLVFSCDVDDDDVNEVFTATTNSSGNAQTSVNFTLPWGTVKPYTVSWNGIVITVSLQRTVTVAGNCPLNAELSGDCTVNHMDLSLLADKWLVSGDPGNCQLTEDIAGNDCYVNFADFAALAREWLTGY